MRVTTKELTHGMRPILHYGADGVTHVFGMLPHELPTVVWVGNATGNDDPFSFVELSWNVDDECDSIFEDASAHDEWDVLSPSNEEED